MTFAFARRQWVQGLASPLPPEIAFLARHGVSPEVLAEAAARAQAAGIGADQVLLRRGLLAEDAFYRALADELGLPFLEDGLAAHPFARVPEAIAAGIVPLAARPDGVSFALAPSGPGLGDILSRGRLAPGLAVTTPTALRRAVFAARGEAIAREAAEGLARRQPESCYRDGATLAQLAVACGLGCLGGFAAALSPAEAWMSLTGLLSLPFLGLVVIKLAAMLEPAPVALPRAPRRIPDRDLPVYSVLVPLYREGRILPRLLAALRALDYPALCS